MSETSGGHSETPLTRPLPHTACRDWCIVIGWTCV